MKFDPNKWNMKFAILSCIFIFMFVDMMKFDHFEVMNAVCVHDSSALFIMPITQKLQLGPIERFLSNRRVSLQSKGFSPIERFLSIKRVSLHSKGFSHLDPLVF